MKEKNKIIEGNPKEHSLGSPEEEPNIMVFFIFTVMVLLIGVILYYGL